MLKLVEWLLLIIMKLKVLLLFIILQVVLLTDGMDTRPYRLNWPNSTIIYDISPERIFKNSAKKLEGLFPSFKWFLIGCNGSS